MFSILHCADLHLEASFASGQLPAAVGRRRRADLRATLERVLALAQERRVDAVTIAGDLYEQDYAPLHLASFLGQALAAVAPLRILIAPGDCDPYTSESLYALNTWPDNVHVFLPGPPAPVELASGLYVWGAGCSPGDGQGLPEGWQANRTGSNLLLLHAAWTGPAGGPPEAFRLGPQALQSAGFDLALLGHEHHPRMQMEDPPRYIYPGSPEPLALSEARGDHGVVLVTIEDGAYMAEAIPVSQWRYLSQRVDLSGCGSGDEAAGLIKVVLRDQLGDAGERAVCQVMLVGNCRFHLDIDALAAQMDTVAHVQFHTQLSPSHSLEELALEPTVRGLMAAALRDRQAGAAGDAERALTERALALALQALDGKQVRRHESG